MTLRRALDTLERQGRVRRVIGRTGGTFVEAPPRVECDLTTVVGFTETVRRAGLAAGAVSSRRSAYGLRARSQSPSASVTGSRSCPWCGYGPPEVTRSRSSTRGSPPALLPGLLQHPLDGSLYACSTRRTAVRPTRADEALEPVVAGPAEAALLDVTPGSPLMRVERTAYDAGGSSGGVRPGPVPGGPQPVRAAGRRSRLELPRPGQMLPDEPGDEGGVLDLGDVARLRQDEDAAVPEGATRALSGGSPHEPVLAAVDEQGRSGDPRGLLPQRVRSAGEERRARCPGSTGPSRRRRTAAVARASTSRSAAARHSGATADGSAKHSSTSPSTRRLGVTDATCLASSDPRPGVARVTTWLRHRPGTRSGSAGETRVSVRTRSGRRGRHRGRHRAAHGVAEQVDRPAAVGLDEGHDRAGVAGDAVVAVVRRWAEAEAGQVGGPARRGPRRAGP